MSQIQTSGKGRSVDVDLNLVPFIDLMSVLITFLLISAVWTQVSMIQLGASFASPQDPGADKYTPPPLEDLILRLDVVQSGYILIIGTVTKPIPKIDNQYNAAALVDELTKIKKRYPEKNGIKIAISDDIIYEYVIQVMDAGLKSGFAPELLTGGPS
ncbi:MAG: biopolymer transporter ExbD [Bdellovibrionota bacterium]